MGDTAKPVAIVDDDASLCRSLARLLRLAGYEPSTFSSAEDFLDQSDDRRFFCVLLDVQLGGMSGLDLQRAMAERGDPTAIIFITALDDAAMRAEATRGGCAAFFSKTDDGTRILDAIRRAAAA
jgi:FixJ family two-component response regulator